MDVKVKNNYCAKDKKKYTLPWLVSRNNNHLRNTPWIKYKNRSDMRLEGLNSRKVLSQSWTLALPKYFLANEHCRYILALILEDWNIYIYSQ